MAAADPQECQTPKSARPPRQAKGLRRPRARERAEATRHGGRACPLGREGREQPGFRKCTQEGISLRGTVTQDDAPSGYGYTAGALATEPNPQPTVMHVRSEVEIKDRDLRLLQRADSSETETRVEAKSVVRTYPQSGAKSTTLVYEMNGTLYQTWYGPHPEAVLCDEGETDTRCLVEFEMKSDVKQEVLNDRGARYAKQKSSPPTNLPGRPS